MRHYWLRRRRDDRGAVAVLVALSSALLLSMAALAVDLGNGWTQRREVQTEADMAALAGGASLPADDVTARALLATEVLAYLKANETYSQDDGASDTWTVAQLLDGDPANGEADFTLGRTKLRVVTPPSLVEYGFAGVMGFDNAEVNATATVEISSVLRGGVLPMYLLTGCSWGSQIIKDGTSSTEPDPQFNPTGTSSSAPAVTRSQTEPVLAGVPSTITLEGPDFTGVTEVGFTQDDRNWTAPATNIQAPSGSGNAKLPATLQVDIPAGVYNQPGTWFVRVFNGTQWTKNSSAFPVPVETTSAEGCGVHETGDFGLIQSPRSDSNSGSWLEDNIAKGLDHTLAVWPDDPGAANGECPSSAVNGTSPLLDYDPPRGPVDNANCINIYNGNQVSKTTDGLQERLAGPTAPGCDPRGGSSSLDVGGVMVNNDVLSCFLPPGTPVGAISSSTLDPLHEHVLDAAIFDSPRLFWVPMIAGSVNPQNGDYALVEYRPVFITDEPFSATNGSGGASTRNGIFVSSKQVSRIQVVAFNANALPATTVSGADPTLPYTGTGPRVITLIE